MNIQRAFTLRPLVVAITISVALVHSLLAVPPSATGQKVLTNATVNVRATANGTILGTQPSGRQGTVTGGPTTTGGYTWWNVNFDSGLDGWVASIGIDVLPPNLVPSNYTISPNSGPAGTSFNVSFRINNTGGSSAAAFNTNVRMSTSSSSPSTSDPLLITFSTASLAVGSIANANADVTIPAGTSSGTQYIWVIVDVNNTSGQTSAQYGDDRIYLSFAVTVPPNSPSGLVAFANEDLVSLAWNDNSSNESGFKIERKTGSGGSYSQMATTGQNVAAYIDNSISPGNTYYYRVRAYNGAGDSAYSNEFSITPQRAPEISSVSPSPVIGSASQQIITINGSYFVNKPTLKLTWTGQSNYIVPSGQVTYISSSQLQMAITVQNTADNWTVQATNPDSQQSNTLGFQVVVPPETPGYLEVQAFSNRVELGWTDTSTNETGFKIERRTGGGAYSQIATTGANSGNAAYYTDNSTSPQTTYTYRVRAYNAAGNSGYNNEVTATTPGGPPGAFTLSNDQPVWDASIPGPKVQLNWTPSTDVGNYALYRNGALYVAGIGGTSYLNSANLTAGATYTYFIRASNADGTTDSNTITVTMPSAPQTVPNAPGYMEAQAFTDRIELGWTDNSTNETGFKIERRTGSGSYSQIGTTSENSGNSAFYTDNTTAPQTTYTYRVRAYNAAGNSGYNTEVTATTPGTTTLGPFTLSNHAPYWDSSAPAGPAVRLNWTFSDGAINYDVYRNNTLYAANIAALSFLNNLNLTGGQTYSYHVIAKKGAETRQSNTIQVTMPTAPPVTPATLASVRVQGPSQAVPGSSVPYQCFALFSDGQEIEVTANAQWSITGTVPPSTFVAGGVLQLGATATGGTLTLSASYQTSLDQHGRTAQKSVTISTGFAANAAGTTQRLGGTNFQINLSATPIGGAAPYSFTWDTNGDSVYGDLTGQNPQWPLTSTGGTYRAKVRVTDAASRIATATYTFSIDKLIGPTQPEKLAPASAPEGGVFLAKDGSNFNFDPDRVKNGLIVLTHGWKGSGHNQWLKDMATAIEQKIPADKRPNILIYNWDDNSDPAKIDSKWLVLAREEIRNSGIGVTQPALSSVLKKAMTTASITALVEGLVAVRYTGRHNGIALGNMLITEKNAVPPRVDFSKPVHFIGHSAGGFVVGEAALVLRQKSLLVDRVTMLDTPFPFKPHLTEVPNEPVVEQYISSLYGTLAFPNIIGLEETNYRKKFSIIDSSYFYAKTILPSEHERSHEWYELTVPPVSGYGNQGFYHSPFVAGPVVSTKSSPVFAPGNTKENIPPPFEFPPFPGESDLMISGFSTFGEVTENASAYTITEQADAGIFKSVQVPHGIVSLRFKFRFSGESDGDFLGVRLGQRAEIYTAPDGPVTRGDFLEAEVEMGAFAGLTDNIVFTLVSRGSPGAVLEIKDVEFIEGDDPDGDGLTVAQELAAGTSSQNSDTDGDGWSDSYEVNVSQTNPTRADTDGDGVFDPDELFAGTDPNDGSSAFVIKETTRNLDGSITLRWSAETGKSYRILMSSSPSFEDFETIASKLTGVTPVTSYTVPSALLSEKPTAFFRVGVE